MMRPRFWNVSWGSGFSSMVWDRAGGRKRQRGQRFALEPLESRCLLTIVPFPLPKISGIQTVPGEITVASNKVWFAESPINAIGMIDPFNPGPPQSFSSGLSSGPVGITTGSDGNVWFTEPETGKIGMLNTSNPAHPIQNFSLPGSPTPVPSGITVGVDQHGKSVLWYTDLMNNAIGMIDPSNPGSPPAEIKLPSTLVGGIGTQIVTGPGGALWFTEVKFDPTTAAVTASAIGTYNPATAKWSEVSLPSGQRQGPFGLTVGPDNNIWFGEAVQDLTGATSYLSSALGMINPSVTPLAVTETAIPPASSGATRLPFRLVAGPDGAVWFTDNLNSQVVAFDPASKTFTAFTAPTETAFSPIPDGITAGLGVVWFTDNSGSVDAATVDTQIKVTTQPTTVNVNSPFNLTVSVTYANTGKGYNGTATISLNNPGGATLGGPTMATITNGVATFSGLTLNQVGSYTLKVTGGSSGTTTVTTNPFNVVSPTTGATHFVVTTQPPGSVTAGAPFGLTVFAETASNAIDPTFKGTVTVIMANNPGGASLGGTTTVAAVNGVATFSGLTLSNAGVGYILSVSGSGLTPASTNPITVTPSLPPIVPPAEITGESVLFTQKTNKRGKKVGKPVLTGFQINFNTAMNPATAGNRANYSLGTYVLVRQRVGRKTVKVLQLKPVGFSVTYNASNNSVALLLSGKQTFSKGGQITLIAAPPGGISSSAGGLLDGNGDGTGGDNAVFNISSNARSISHA